MRTTFCRIVDVERHLADFFFLRIYLMDRLGDGIDEGNRLLEFYCSDEYFPCGLLVSTNGLRAAIISWELDSLVVRRWEGFHRVEPQGTEDRIVGCLGLYDRELHRSNDVSSIDGETYCPEHLFGGSIESGEGTGRRLHVF